MIRLLRLVLKRPLLRSSDRFHLPSGFLVGLSTSWHFLRLRGSLFCDRVARMDAQQFQLLTQHLLAVERLQAQTIDLLNRILYLAAQKSGGFDALRARFGSVPAFSQNVMPPAQNVMPYT